MRTTLAHVVDRFEMSHEARQIFEVAPEAVDLFGRKIYDTRSFCVNAVVTAVAELHCAHHVERGDGEHIRRSKRNTSQLRFGITRSNAEAGQIHRVTDYARPHSLSWFLLSKDRDAGADFAQTVQSY